MDIPQKGNSSTANRDRMDRKRKNPRPRLVPAWMNPDKAEPQVTEQRERDEQHGESPGAHMVCIFLLFFPPFISKKNFWEIYGVFHSQRETTKKNLSSRKKRGGECLISYSIQLFLINLLSFFFFCYLQACCSITEAAQGCTYFSNQIFKP